MNQDHADTCKAYVMAFGEHERCTNETKEATLVALDQHGLLLDVTLTDGTILSKVRVPYQGKVSSASDLRREAVNMHTLANSKLGFWYRIRNGYYQQLAKVTWFKACREVKEKPIRISAIITTSITLFAVGLLQLEPERRVYCYISHRQSKLNCSANKKLF